MDNKCQHRFIPRTTEWNEVRRFEVIQYGDYLLEEVTCEKCGLTALRAYTAKHPELLSEDLKTFIKT